MNRQILENELYEKVLGKTIFFMSENKITVGVITGQDNYQLFIGKTQSIKNDKNFFFTLQDLIESLRDNIGEVS